MSPRSKGPDTSPQPLLIQGWSGECTGHKRSTTRKCGAGWKRSTTGCVRVSATVRYAVHWCSANTFKPMRPLPSRTVAQRDEQSKDQVHCRGSHNAQPRMRTKDPIWSLHSAIAICLLILRQLVRISGWLLRYREYHLWLTFQGRKMRMRRRGFRGFSFVYGVDLLFGKINNLVFQRNSHMVRSIFSVVLIASFCLVPASVSMQAQAVPEAALAGLHWRDVGPMRGGRSYGVAGSPSQPDTFYFGSVGGGVWKTVNAGRTWGPIADQGIPIGSIGAIAVAPSNPSVIYVGTGEPDIRSQHSYGIGMFKSVDEGKTWTHIGLENSEHIGRIVVDPANPDRVYVAVLGHVYDARLETRCLPFARRRQDMEEGPLQNFGPGQCRRHRASHQSPEPEGALRISMGNTSSAVVGVRAVLYAWQRTL